MRDSIPEILNGRHYATLATHNEDGSIHTTPVWYVFENGNLYVGSPSHSRKARNVAARPNATMLVDIRRPGNESWVSASGHAETIRGDDSRTINSRIFNRYLTREAISDPRIGPAFTVANDITIFLVPESWRSWSSKDVDEQFFGGILAGNPEKWFRPVDD